MRTGSPVLKAAAEAAPKAMNVRVARRERMDRRALPQMPWPEVQPLPM